ncbi:hypothetical protein L202_06452 [Cryptococcus amylolentus CBS 6039]|uniref:Uncharacterized protein n=2 Tax=Cryptococcus amylolentus TaxID=104669 RepID=A0A1E3HHN8_9TREE|nr:hypothetical protein L202_06452 [Cryptococcus amylolentus CBS 6039]ODN75266.1 hypothetical protein L202_06452 [Cryptococcus amylolentus CBS 6039]ODO03035.1 hypothetical protein I350_05880 [Cryptococcus amylolentus CBS 6273]
MRLPCCNCTTLDGEDSKPAFSRDVRSAAPSPSQSPPTLPGPPRVKIIPATPISGLDDIPHPEPAPDTASPVITPPTVPTASSRVSLNGRRPPFIRSASASQSPNPNPSLTSFFRSHSDIPPRRVSGDTVMPSNIPRLARTPEQSTPGRPRSTFTQRLSGFFETYKPKYLQGSHNPHGTAEEVGATQTGAGTVYLPSPHRDLPDDPFASRIDMADGGDLGPLCLLPRESEDSRYTGSEVGRNIKSERESGPGEATVVVQGAFLRTMPAPSPSPTARPYPFPVATKVTYPADDDSATAMPRTSRDHHFPGFAKQSEASGRVKMMEKNLGQGIDMRGSAAVLA